MSKKKWLDNIIFGLRDITCTIQAKISFANFYAETPFFQLDYLRGRCSKLNKAGTFRKWTARTF